MGLAASQARLLTITSRKSDCEFQSMRLSHEKIALSRSMTDISNEYQNALDQTKLVYDFYGTNDKSLDVSYDLLMKPSELNGYMPILTTDSTGKVVLSAKYAAAARAAGIPTEGLGTLPSDLLRNRYLESLQATGIITSAACESYKAITYSQDVGVGSTAAVSEIVEEMTYEEMLENYFKNINIDLSEGINPDIDCAVDDSLRVLVNTTEEGATNVSMYDILNGNTQYTLVYKARARDSYNEDQAQMEGMTSISNWWLNDGAGEALLAQLREALSTSDPAVQTALAYADTMVNKMVNVDSVLQLTNRADAGDNKTKFDVNKKDTVAIEMGGADDKFVYDSKIIGSSKGNNREAAELFQQDFAIVTNAKNYIGYYSRTVRMPSDDKHVQYESLSMNIGNVLKAYLTYFADAMSGFNSEYYVNKGGKMSITDNDHLCVTMTGGRTVAESKLVGNTPAGATKPLDFTFNVVTCREVNASDALMSSFYDALFNQICMRGWVENNNVTNNEYLQDMFKNGMMYVTATSEDGYYYQNNYGSFSYIKEVADDEAIARAEAKYNTEKAKLTHKEEMLDLKMKNLDTEISSLTTEYDTIKSLISKNIERGFKRYDA